MAGERNTPCRLGAICGAVSVKRMHIGTMRNSTLRVAWVIGGIGHGGVRTICENATEAVARLTDHEVSLVCVHSHTEDFRAPPGVRFHGLWLPEEPVAAANGFHRWLLDEPQDVLVMNDVSMLEPFWPYVPEQTRLVVVLHDSGYAWRRGVVLQHRCLDGIVTVARHIEDLLRREIDEFQGLMRTIHNGSYYPDPPARTYHGERLRLLFLGRVSEGKGILDLPKIMKRLKRMGSRARLEIIGGRSRSLTKAIKKARVEEDVQFSGYLSRDECFRRLAQSDILLVLSRYEAFGMVTIEAMAMGCVPIGYGVGGMREIVLDGETGFLVPLGDLSAFAGKIAEMERDRGRLAKMASCAMHRARSVFSAERMGREYARLLEELAETRHRQRRVRRLPFADFAFSRRYTRRYARLLPGSLRGLLRKAIERSPVISYYTRNWRGV